MDPGFLSVISVSSVAKSSSAFVVTAAYPNHNLLAADFCLLYTPIREE
jgi:hypothetical protein